MTRRVAVCGVAVVIAACAAGLTAPLAGSRSRSPIRPVLGNWEGRGPLGLRLSFAFARRGGHTIVRDLALGLPTGCRSQGFQTWIAETLPSVEYIAPGSVLQGPFPPLGPTQFEWSVTFPGTPIPVEMVGTFSSARRGVISIPSPTRIGCPHTGWPRTLRFTLAATHRIRIPDGVWTGTVAGPPAGATGTVRIRVIDGGRIETDFSASYSCPSGGGSFEIGPLATVGYLITADGRIGGMRGTENAWTGRFAPGGQLGGRLGSIDCGSPAAHPTFTAHP